MPSPGGGTFANLYFVIGSLRLDANRQMYRMEAAHKTQASRKAVYSVFGIMSQPNIILQATIVGSMLSVCSCGTPRVNGVPAAPPAPNLPWKAPAGAIKPEPLITPVTALAVPPDLEQRIQQLTLVDVVDLAGLRDCGCFR